MTSYIKTEPLSPKLNYIRNVLQPTRSLCHFRFKSYGPLSVSHKSGDLDLACYPIFQKKSSALSRVQKTSFGKKIRTIGLAVRPVEPLKTDKQTNRHTNRGDQYTFRKSKISKSNESRSESGNTFRKRYVFYSAIDLDCNMSRSKVKGIVYLVVIIQRNSVQCGDFHFS